MSDDNVEQKIKDKLSAIFPSPEVASKMVDIVVAERPIGWSRKSNAPYYKEIYANQMKKEIAKMMTAKNQPLIYRYSVFCNEDEGGMSENTLYSRINQSIRFLIEKSPTSEERAYYKQWYDSVHISKRRGVGVIIKFITGMEGADPSGFTGELTESDENKPKWKLEMEEWIEGTSIQPFVKEGLMLTPEEIVQLKNEFINIRSVQASIKSESVKIVRINRG